MNHRPANQRLMQAVRMFCGRRPGLTVPAFALLGFSVVSVALAGPTGGVVVDGQATISTPTAGTTVIDQASQHVQLNWNSFNVGANESVQFQQPNSSSVALNRILDQNPSQIFGRIDANGQVILVNPNGMLFGASAQLNVGSLVASSLDVIGFDGATGRYTFGTSRADVGSIVNEGAIAAARGGSVTLLGGRVTNTGSIIADFGTVNLAAGRAATLDLAGDGLLRLEVDSELISNKDGAGAAVENGGVIQANGGQVLLTAQAVDDVFANLVNNTGMVRAARIDNSGGTIRLTGAGGTVRSSGVLDASAGDDVSGGGRVEMLGEQVGLFDSAMVDVSGATNGGTALIGGDYQGKNPDVLNAARTYVSSNASIRADAGLYGDGGRVIVWADEITRFGGSISARGGALSGNGGFAEVSGKETLLFSGSANLSAANGFAGELLLDPRNIIVAEGGEGDLAGDTGDDSDADTYAFAEDPDDDITIAPSTITDILDTGTTVTLQAHNDITVEDAIDGSESTTAGGGLTFQAGDDIFIYADIRTNDGAIEFTAGDDGATTTGTDGSEAPLGEMLLESGVTLSAGNAAVTLNSDGNMELLGTVSGNAITANSGGTLTVGTLNAGSGNVNLTATGSLLDDGVDTTRITAASLTLDAGLAIGTSATSGQIDTDVTTLSATADAGGVYINESNGLRLTDVSASGDGNDVHVFSQAGDIVVGEVTAPDTVTLHSGSGAIIDDLDNDTSIAAQTLSLHAAMGIGATGTNDQIDMDVTSLTAETTLGSIYIGESDGLSLSATAHDSDSDIVVTSASGDIVAGDVSAGNSVTLNATTGAILDDGLTSTRISTSTLTLDAGTAIGTSGVGEQIGTDVQFLSATAHAGGVYIDEANGLVLSHVEADGDGNDVHVHSASGNIIVDTVTAPDSVTLIAASGAIVDDGNSNTNISASTLTLDAHTSIGGSGALARIGTDVDSLTADAELGGIYIREVNDIVLTSVDAAGVSGDVIVTNTTGDITVGAVRATNQVTLTATDGNIRDDANNDTRIVANTATLSGRAIGGSALDAQIDTDVVSLGADASAGSIYIGELNGLTLTDIDAAGTGSDVDVTSATGDIVATSVSAADAVSLTAALGDIEVGSITAGNAVTLTATTGSITDDDSNSTRIDTATLTLNAGGAIGATGANGQIDTDVNSLTASADAGGIYIGELDGLTLTDVEAAGTGSDVVVNAAGNIVATSVTAADTVSLTTTALDIQVGNITAENSATLIATSGSIFDDGVNSTRIETGDLTLNAYAIGATGGNGQIDTDVSSLTALARAGGIYIGELNGLTLAEVSNISAGNDVNVTSITGDIVANTVTALGAITLETTGEIEAGIIQANGAVSLEANAIVDDDDNGTVISGSSVSLSAVSNIGTVTAFDAVNDADVGSSVDVQTTGALTAVVTDNDGQINLNLAAVPTLNSGAITLGNGSNASGAVVLQSAGNLDMSGFTSDAIHIGSNNSTQLGLRSGGTLTLPSSGGFTDEAADYLLVSGTDIRDNDANAHDLTFSADTLDFRSGGAGGATTLHTTVDHLSATLGNNQDMTVIETDGLSLGTLDVGSGNITLTAGGAVTDDNIDLTRIVSNSANLTGTSLGADGNELDTQVNTLEATATSGAVYVSEADALALTVSATGAADVRTTNGALTVTSATGNGVTLVAGGDGSGITLNGAVNAGAGDVELTAGSDASRGAIVAGAVHQITGHALTVTGSTIGSGGRLNTNVTSIDATSTSGGIFITEADALSLSANASGAVDVETTNGALTVTEATGNAVRLVAGGDGNSIEVNGAISAGAGDVTLTAGTVASRGAIVAGADNQVSGGLLTVDGTTVGTSTARLNTNVGSIDATAANGGIFITEANALTLTAAATNGMVDVRTNNGALGVTSATGDGVTLAAGGAGNGIFLNGGVNAGTGDVRLTAGGAIVSTNGDQIIGGSLIVSGSSVGTSTAGLNTTVDSIDATSTNGGIFITETDTLTLTANATGGEVDVQTLNGSLTAEAANGDGVTLIAGGAGSNITVNGAVNGRAGDVTLTAGTAASRGAIVAGAVNQVSGGSLIVNGTTIGTSTARLNTNVASFDANATDGGIFVTEADALTLTANATNGAVDVRTNNGALDVTSVTGDGVTLVVGGAGNGLTLNGGVNAGAGDVTLTAGGAIVSTNGDQITGGSLIASGSSVGTSTARLNTTVASIDATSTNGGIFITETDALTLTANATGGPVDVQTLNGSLSVGAANGDGVTLIAGGAGSGITLNGAVNGRAGDVVLTAGTAGSRGAIVGTAGHSIAGHALTANATTIGSSNARLNTSIDSLTAAASTGDVYISEQNGLTLANVTAARDIGVASATGDIIVGTVAAANDVTLTATSGAIADDRDDSTILSADALTLGARSIGAASTLSGTTLDSSGRLDTDVQTLSATTSAGGIFIDEANGLLNVSVQASGGDDGDIELLTRAGDLILDRVSASDRLLLAAGRNIFAAPGSGPVTARAAELRAGTTDPDGGLIGTLSDPIKFQLSAGNSLRLFVPQTIDPEDPNRAPAVAPSTGATSTLILFASQNPLASRAGFSQFQGLGEMQFTSPAETLVRSLQNQTGVVQTGLDIDWGSYDPDVSLFGTLEPSVCLPADQRDEESSTPEC